MTRTIQALYEDGVLKPLEPLKGVAERSEVKVVVELKERSPHPLVECLGIMPDEDAEEMLRIIEEEFERVVATFDPHFDRIEDLNVEVPYL